MSFFFENIGYFAVMKWQYLRTLQWNAWLGLFPPWKWMHLQWELETVSLIFHSSRSKVQYRDRCEWECSIFQLTFFDRSKIELRIFFGKEVALKWMFHCNPLQHKIGIFSSFHAWDWICPVQDWWWSRKYKTQWSDLFSNAFSHSVTEIDLNKKINK